MISIYTSLYNLKANIFDWKNRLLYFKELASEVVVATTQNQDDSYLELKPFCLENSIKLIITDISLKDLDFDGRLKNAALKACSMPVCSLLDIDEYFLQKHVKNWNNLAEKLLNSNHEAVFIPVIDLFFDKNHYKSIGAKWYLHKNNYNICRGIVNFAKKENGKIDHTKSDTTELIHLDGSLVSAASIIDLSMPDNYKLEIINKNNIYVLHEGWLNKKQRQKQNDFWKPVWNNRAGFSIDSSINFDTIQYYKHNLEI